MYKEKIFDVTTGETTWRDYTPDEIAEVEAAQLRAKERAEAAAEINVKKMAALSKLEALGFDEDDLKALGL